MDSFVTVVKSPLSERPPEEGGLVGEYSRGGEESRAEINSLEESRHDPNLAGGASALSVNNSKPQKVIALLLNNKKIRINPFSLKRMQRK